MQNIVNSLGRFVDSKTPQYVYVEIDKNTTLTPRDHIINVVDDVTVTLPPVGDCAGLIFSITAEGSVEIEDQDDSIGWDDITLAEDDSLLLWCDGRKFWTLSGPEEEGGGG